MEFQKQLKVCAAIIGVFVLAACSHIADESTISEPPPVTQSTELTLADGWQFYRFDGGVFEVNNLPDTGWSEVRLPHSAKIEPRIVNDQWQGDAVYRRNLFAEREWQGKAIWLRFEGAMSVAEIYVNGKEVAGHKGGYLPFTVDLSGLLNWNENNEILVHLDNRDNPLLGPKPLKDLDFNFYGGLYREVRLSIRDNLHVTDEMAADKVAGGGIFVTYPVATKALAKIEVKTDIENTGTASRSFEIEHSLFDNDSVVSVFRSDHLALAPGKAMVSDAVMEVNAPRLWSPDSPHLYTLRTRLLDGDRIVDERMTSIGIRRIQIAADGFWINGEKKFLRGVNRHQEYPYIGYALSPNADYRDAKLIKEAGFDYVRLSHYPHSRHFMKAADELGLVVLDAILGWQYYNDDPAFTGQVIQTCRDMIRRDRNHPSVIAWECSLNESAMPLELLEKFNKVVHEECPGDQAYSAGWLPEAYDIYLQARQHRLPHPEAKIPNKPYVVSEYGDWEYYAQNAGLNQGAWQDLSEEARTSRQLLKDGEIRLLQQATNLQEAHNDNLSTPAFADGYWVMFDYNRGYAPDLEASGIMSLERIAKPSYHFYRSQRDSSASSATYNSGPMVHIANEWRRGSPTDVRVFSNGGEVELFLNGKSQGRQTPDSGPLSENLRHPPFTFRLGKFQPGNLLAVAYHNGKATARHTIRTPGSVSAVKAELATQGVTPVQDDVLFAHAWLIDRLGTTVPLTGQEISFSFGNGLELIGPASIPSENGTAATLVRVVDPSANLSVTARAE